VKEIIKKKPLIIISSAQMGPGTFEAKFIPLSKLSCVEKIYVLRDKPGPEIDKVEYIILPRFISTFKPFKVFIPFILAKKAKNKKCNLIIGYHIIPHAFFAFFAGLLTGIPFACTQTGIFIQRQSQHKILGFFLKWVFRRALFVNVPGQMSKDYWINFGVDPNKINLLHSTIDTKRFYNYNTKREFDFIILSRLSEEKRIEHLLNIFFELKREGHNFSACIAGDGPRRDFLKVKAVDLGLDKVVSFVGFVDKPEEWFNRSKVFLLSSETEGLPTALMQAMACELVCVSTNVGNISDTIVHDKNGFLVNFGDWEIYKKILKEILLNKETEKMNKISILARESVIKTHSHEFAISEWMSIFKTYFPEVITK
jgi:glycosyltransferase involved in cell wall biosynthesis